ncbi:MAG: right-handed parallel beta-helix repeat-containing protein, partial [Anaerolineae bacterium]|nr:right-handed parallel beta-helix repeat-containing protein [Phycisphaerae bacterium]
FQENADGINLSARFALLTDDYTITGNQVIDNNNNGIALDAQFDATLSTILTSNTITGNLDDGIHISTTTVAGDVGSVTSGLGPWTLNVISNNGTGNADAGIDISGVHNITLGTLAAGNTIQNNTGDGIEINFAPGTLNVVNATITGNNTEGTGDNLAGININSSGGNIVNVSNSTISDNLGDGVEINSTGVSLYTFTDNLIQRNQRDGFEFAEGGSSDLTINGTGVGTNLITDNFFRGIDIIVATSNPTVSTVNIDNTQVLRNGRLSVFNGEGVYVVFSSDAAQRTAAFRDNQASLALANGGAVNSRPGLIFNMTNNIINNNGQAVGNIGGAGFVMRVGTSFGGLGFTTPGFFASDTLDGVVATVTDNSFGGNAGADVVFESFRSTVNPNTTGGTWDDQDTAVRDNTNDTFNPTGFQSDPLARLDLIFNGNVGDELDATRQGAFYNNDEAVFKSRTQSQDTATDAPLLGGDDDGPFGSGARPRNAQRLAARDVAPGGTQLPPNIPTAANGGAFLFSGMGQSTFRVNLTGGNSFGLPTPTSDFLLDNNPYVDFNDANGDPLGAPNGGVAPFFIDNMPWGWSIFP